MEFLRAGEIDAAYAGFVTRGEFSIVCEVEPATRPDLMHVRHQIGVLSRVASSFLIPDNHIGRATVSSIAVAHEVALMGGRSIACLNARDRNMLGFRRDLLTAAAYGVDEFLFVYGDRPESGSRSDDLTVRSMIDRGAPFRCRLGTRFEPVAARCHNSTASSACLEARSRLPVRPGELFGGGIAGLEGRDRVRWSRVRRRDSGTVSDDGAQAVRRGPRAHRPGRAHEGARCRSRRGRGLRLSHGDRHSGLRCVRRRSPDTGIALTGR